MVLRCYMPGCNNKGNFGFHKFPRNGEICSKWQHVSRRRNLNTSSLPYSHYRICENHFKGEDYLKSVNGKRRLQKFAVPSVLIPVESSVYEEHNYTQLSIYQQEENGSIHILQQSNSQFEVADFNPNSSLRYSPNLNNINPVVDDIRADVSSDTANIQRSLPNLKRKYPNESTDTANDQHSSPKIKRKSPTVFTDTAKNQRLSPNIKRKEERNMRRNLKYSKGRIQFLQKKLKESANLSKDKVIQYLSSKFSKELMAFFMMQLRNSGRKNHGQRYSNEEKCMLLALYKHGARSYRFLSQLFSLPSKRTLCRHSALLQLKTGINPKLFQFIKSKAAQLDNVDKYCTIAWDEMAVTTHLNFCDSKDAMDGFVDLGDVQIPEFATHALVFMIRGVTLAYKQPVAYFFTNNLNSDQLSELIKLVICEVLNTGMKIIGSVCDQASIMATAVNLLAYPNMRRVKQNGQLLSYIVQGNRIIHCFDPPHILKSIRNNLHSKNLKHFVSGVWDYHSMNKTQVENDAKFATWDDVREFYKINIGNTTRLLRKITEEHIDPNRLKMKVSVAAQVFSNTFGNIMLFCSKHNQLPRDFSGTGHILVFFNDLFDSLNGAGKSNVNPLRSSINMNNKGKHFEFWNYAITMLEKMTFVDKLTGNVNNKSSVLKKAISTIKGYMELTNLCLSLGIESVSVRQTNQDGLENFFDNLRASCQTKKQPMAFQFRSAFTNLIVNNLTCKHSMRSNCQDDKSFALLQDVYDFYDMDFEEEQDGLEDDEVIVELPNTKEIDFNFFEAEALVYESGKVCKSVLSTIKCEFCRNTLEAYCPLSQHGILQECEIKTEPANHIFTYPTLLFMSKFKTLFRKIEITLPFICHEKDLSQKLIKSLDNDSLINLGCDEHTSEISQKIKKATVQVGISIFVKDVNNILSKKTLEPPQNQHAIHEKAFKIVKKKRGIGKHGEVRGIGKYGEVPLT